METKTSGTEPGARSSVGMSNIGSTANGKQTLYKWTKNHIEEMYKNKKISATQYGELTNALERGKLHIDIVHVKPPGHGSVTAGLTEQLTTAFKEGLDPADANKILNAPVNAHVLNIENLIQSI